MLCCFHLPWQIHFWYFHYVIKTLRRRRDSFPPPTPYLDGFNFVSNDAMLCIWSEQLKLLPNTVWRSNRCQDTDGQFFPPFLSLFSSFFSSLQQGRDKKMIVSFLTFFLEKKTPWEDASYITFTFLTFLFWVHFFYSSQSTSVATCRMWCCSITGSLNVRSCRDQGTWRQKVNGVTAMGGGSTSGGMAWWKCMLGRINGSSHTRMPAAETGHKCSHHSNTPHPPPRLAMRWSGCFRWVCTVGRIYLGWSVYVCQAGVVVAKRKSAHCLLLQGKSQQSCSFKLQFTVKSPPVCIFFQLLLSICYCCVFR